MNRRNFLQFLGLAPFVAILPTKPKPQRLVLYEGVPPAPTYSFNASPDTGWYRVNKGSLALEPVDHIGGMSDF